MTQEVIDLLKDLLRDKIKEVTKYGSEGDKVDELLLLGKANVEIDNVNNLDLIGDDIKPFVPNGPFNPYPWDNPIWINTGKDGMTYGTFTGFGFDPSDYDITIIAKDDTKVETTVEKTDKEDKKDS